MAGKHNPVPMLKQLVSSLEREEITIQEALERSLEARGTAVSWQQTWWKKERKERIGESCERCGTTKPPLVLQHKWHPPKLSEVIKTMTWNEWVAEHPIEIDPSTLPKRISCPECGSMAVYLRKGDGAYVCRGKCRGRVVEPPFVYVTDFKPIATLKKDRWIEYTVYYHQRKTEPTRQEVINWLKGHIRYLSFEDVTTYCKKCAFKEDVWRFGYRPNRH